MVGENLTERVREGEGRAGGFTDVGYDDLGIVAREDDVKFYANARVAVENVRFGIITCIWALPSREGPNGGSGRNC